MSVTDSTIWCDTCDFQSGSGRVFGIFIYRLPDGRDIDLFRISGWCHHCMNIEAIEDLGAQHLQNQKAYYLQQISNETTKLGKSILFKLFGCGRRDLLQWQTMLVILEEQQLLYKSALIRRTSPPKCLRCGGTNITPVKLPSPKAGEELELKFKHPGCGGKLRTKQSSTRFHIRFPRRIYDLEGSFLGEEENS